MICTPFGRVVALDPARGTERWVFDPKSRIGGYATPEDPEGLASPGFANCRGVAWWEDRHGAGRRAVPAPDLPRDPRPAPGGARRAHRAGSARISAPAGIVDIEPTVLNAQPPAVKGEVKFSGPPAVINDVVALGTSVRDFNRANAPNGSVRAFDARTGAPRWTFDPVPRSAADPAYAGWTPEAARNTGAGNVWGVMSADEAAGPAVPAHLGPFAGLLRRHAAR